MKINTLVRVGDAIELLSNELHAHIDTILKALYDNDIIDDASIKQLNNYFQEED